MQLEIILAWQSGSDTFSFRFYSLISKIGRISIHDLKKLEVYREKQHKQNKTWKCKVHSIVRSL